MTATRLQKLISTLRRWSDWDQRSPPFGDKIEVTGVERPGAVGTLERESLWKQRSVCRLNYGQSCSIQIRGRLI